MESGTFSLDDYDCIGFDLDCTLAEYNVKELAKLTYFCLVNYLIKNKSYESEFLLSAFDEEEYFLQKGLVMDFPKGNVLKIGGKGEILKATHGTKPLSEDEIVKEYGSRKSLSVFKEFIEDPLLLMKSPYEKTLRTTLDYFDMACTLIFAKIVDHLDKKNGEVLAEYNIWPDILLGLYNIYNRNSFVTGESEFYCALKNDPSKFYKKWAPEKLAWLKELKSKKFVFVLTGSFVDFAELTASYCMGENWKDYFDVVLCYGRKPYFFYAGHPFLKDLQGTKPVKEENLQVNSVYTQGNWEKLRDLISEKTKVKEPKSLYIGDNLIQDVCAPVRFRCCDSVAVLLELKEEFGISPLWGSFFEETLKEGTSYWNYVIKKHAMICITGLDVFLSRPLNFGYHRLSLEKTNELSERNGYYIN